MIQQLELVITLTIQHSIIFSIQNQKRRSTQLISASKQIIITLLPTGLLNLMELQVSIFYLPIVVKQGFPGHRIV